MANRRSVVECTLRCIEESHEPIILHDGEETLIGRNAFTCITDPTCSRHQVILTADYKTETVLLKQVGSNSSGINGFRVSQNEAHTMQDRDHVEILLSKYVHEVAFIVTNNAVLVNGENCRKRSSEGLGLEEITLKKLAVQNDACPENEEDNSDALSILKVSGPATEDIWENIDYGKLLIFTTSGVYNSEKIAAFDLDGTLIKTKSGRVFAKDQEDWQIAFPEVPGSLKCLIADGFKIVIFTNQAGITTGKTNVNAFKKKLGFIVKRFGVPIQAFISTGKGKYRKPMTGMWDTLVKHKNGGISISKSSSFYCGDAAGRADNWAAGKKKDFSSADRLLAENLKVVFYTPEEYFQKRKVVSWTKPEFQPHSLVTDISICNPSDTAFPSDKQEVLLLVGSPASGKSFISRKYLSKYIHITRDVLGSWQKCVSAMQEALKHGQSVVIDNTNPDQISRKRYVDACFGVPIRCGVMSTTMSHAKHNNVFRELTNPNHMKISEMIFNSYKAKFEMPTVSEGFVEVFSLNFIPQFEKKEHREIYFQFLLEK